MERFTVFFASSIGKKLVMAATGIALFGFVLGHMFGNLQIYLGAEALDAYGEFLREMLHGTGIWLARGGVLVAVALHLWAATSLTLSNWSARPEGYRQTEYEEGGKEGDESAARRGHGSSEPSFGSGSHCGARAAGRWILLPASARANRSESVVGGCLIGQVDDDATYIRIRTRRSP